MLWVQIPSEPLPKPIAAQEALDIYVAHDEAAYYDAGFGYNTDYGPGIERDIEALSHTVEQIEGAAQALAEDEGVYDNRKGYGV
jgi:hypothetical protein